VVGDAVDQRTRLSNQLTAVLKRYFPQAIVLVGHDVDRPLACDFLSKWPTLAAVQAAAPATLRKFYYAHHCRHEERIVQRLELVRSAIPLTTDAALIQTGVLQVHCLIGQLRALAKAIQKYEQRLSQLMDEHPDAALFLALIPIPDFSTPLAGMADSLAMRIPAKSVGFGLYFEEYKPETKRGCMISERYARLWRAAD